MHFQGSHANINQKSPALMRSLCWHGMTSLSQPIKGLDLVAIQRSRGGMRLMRIQKWASKNCYRKKRKVVWKSHYFKRQTCKKNKFVDTIRVQIRSVTAVPKQTDDWHLFLIKKKHFTRGDLKHLLRTDEENT